MSELLYYLETLIEIASFQGNSSTPLYSRVSARVGTFLYGVKLLKVISNNSIVTFSDSCDRRWFCNTYITYMYK